MLHRVLSLLSIVFISTLVFAQYNNIGSYAGLEPTGLREAISGTLRDRAGHPVSGARVEVSDLNSGRNLATTYSSASGAFELNGIRGGLYEVVVTSGVTEVRTRVEGGFARDLTLTIPVNQDSDGNTRSAAVSASQMKVPGKARKLFQKALEAFHKARADDAFSFVQQALGTYPDYAKALALRGVLNLQRGDTQRAEPDLEKAVELDYTDDASFVALASLYNTQKKYDDALRVLDRGMVMHPTLWTGLLETARAQNGKHQFDQALVSLAKADKVLPTDVNCQHLFRAQAFIGLKNYSPAIAELQAYLSKEPEGPNAKMAQQTLAELQQVEEAKK